MSLFPRISLPLVLLVALAGCRPDAGPAADPVPPAPSPDASLADGEAPLEAVYRCGDMLVEALFDNAAGNVSLSINARALVLPQTVSASGARYGGEDGADEFWTKGEEATFTLDGIRHDCRMVDETTPWAEARARGVGFRGLGTEPFWAVEVDSGDSPAMRLDLEMGGRRLLVAQASPLADGQGYVGRADDASEVVLRIAEGDCSDGMSDQVYPASVALQVGDRMLSGCGAFLDR